MDPVERSDVEDTAGNSPRIERKVRMAMSIGSWKGSPTVSLAKDESMLARYPFTFGLAKAKLIVEHFEEIKKFVEENDKATPEKTKGGTTIIGPDDVK